MFPLFPIHRPRLGISFRAQALELVEVRRRWRQPPILTRLTNRPLPPGLLTPGASTPNMSDPAALAKELAALLEETRGRAVAIDLPIACGTLALTHFETFPTVRTEQEALLRWRLRQEEHLMAPDLTLLWQSFSSAEPGPSAVAILSVAIRQSLLDQYHRVCEDAELIPVSMGFSTFHVLELARAALTGPQEEVYVAHRSAEALIVLGFRQGRPVLLRVKPLRRVTLDLRTEVLQTIRYFAQDNESRNHTETRTTPLYVVDETASPEPYPDEHAAERWTVQEGWTVPVVRAAWATAPIVSSVPISAHLPVGALASVLAC